MRSHRHGPTRRRRGLLAGFAALLLAATALPVQAQFVTADEDAVKVAFLYNFMNFTEWPAAAFPTPQQPFTLCVVATPSLGRALEALKTKSLNGRPIAVRALAPGESGAACQMIYVEESDVKAARRIIESPAAATALTVSGFPQQGAIITLVRSNNRMAFEINVEAAARAGLKFSSKLLNLAKIVGE